MMSSATSTENVPATDGLQPWQFFVLAALACATAVTLLVRGQGVTPVVLLTILMLATVLVALAALRMVRPLVTAADDRTPMIGERTRAALEREKMLALRAIKELEFDRAMGKVSDDDFHHMATRLRTRATRLMRQLDAGASYRTRIEEEVAKRLSEKGDAARRPEASGAAPIACAACSTTNDPDARFCKECGAKL
jgi:hypothetical protein